MNTLPRGLRRGNPHLPGLAGHKRAAPVWSPYDAAGGRAPTRRARARPAQRDRGRGVADRRDAAVARGGQRRLRDGQPGRLLPPAAQPDLLGDHRAGRGARAGRLRHRPGQAPRARRDGRRARRALEPADEHAVGGQRRPLRRPGPRQGPAAPPDRGGRRHRRHRLPADRRRGRAHRRGRAPDQPDRRRPRHRLGRAPARPAAAARPTSSSCAARRAASSTASRPGTARSTACSRGSSPTR